MSTGSFKTEWTAPRMMGALLLTAFVLRALVPANFMIDPDADTGAISIIPCPGMTTHSAPSSTAGHEAAAAHDGVARQQQTPEHSPASGHDVCPFSTALVLALPQPYHVLETRVAVAEADAPIVARHQRAGFAIRPPLPPRAPPARS